MAASVEEAPLFIKSFFADSVEDTLELARLELGPDALLLNERETPPESRHLGAFEVVFGVRTATPQAPPLVSGQKIENLQQTLKGILGRMEKERAPANPSQPDLALRPPPQARVQAPALPPVQSEPNARAFIAQRLIGDGVAP